jgi:pyruvate dehydrogenase E2 component (dihydrolipoamide acetyltransferase)
MEDPGDAPAAPAPRARDGSAGAVFAAPSVRRLAREMGVDHAAVRASGLGGRVSTEDVRAHGRGAAAPPVAEPLPDFSKWGEIAREPMSAVRRKIAEHMAAAAAAVPQVTLHDKADVTEVESVRLAFKERTGKALTVTAILVRVVASAQKLFPKLGASVDMARSEIVLKKYAHVGIAVDTDRGLLVPVVRDADKKNVSAIAEEIADLSARARAAKLSLDEMRGGTFTVTNLGGLGVRWFTPIVNHPEVAILGVGRAATEAVFDEGGTARPRLLLPLSLSFDHRALDGADGARALRWIKEALEKPLLLALEG